MASLAWYLIKELNAGANQQVQIATFHAISKDSSCTYQTTSGGREVRGKAQSPARAAAGELNNIIADT